MLCLLEDLNKCAEASLCQKWIPFTRPSSEPMVSSCDLLLGRPEHTCRGFPVSLINVLYETIFWDYTIDSISSVSWVTWTNLHRFPVSAMNVLYKTIFQVSLLSTQWAVSWETWMNMQRLLCARYECPWQEHLATKSIIMTWPALSPKKPEKWTCRGFPSVTDVQHFQDQLPTKTIIFPQSSVPWGDLNNEHGEPRFPQCHWEMAFFRPSCH